MNGRSSREWVERACLVLLTVALLAITWRNMDLLGDTFWSVATGRWILEHRSLPAVDPFTFTAERSWIVHMPLCQVVLAGVELRFGVMGLELFGALVFTASLLVLWIPHARGFWTRVLVSPLLVWLVLCQADGLCVRGQVFGDLAFAALLALLFRIRDGKPVPFAFPLLLGALWINLHASVFLAVVLPLAFGAATRAAPPHDRPALRRWVAFSGLAAIGMLLNPYGPKLVVDLVRLMSARSTRRIDLFLPPSFGSAGTWLTLTLVIVAAMACAWSRRHEGGAAEALMLGVLGAAACRAVRFEPIALGFAIAVLGRVADRRFPPVRAGLQTAGYFAVAAGASALAFYGAAADKDPWRDVPLDEAGLIEELPLPDRVANIYHWGGYLDYAWAGRRKVFIDGRNQLFEERVFDDYLGILAIDHWQQHLDDYGINTVLWEKGAPLDHALAASQAWACVRRGRIAVVYVRRQILDRPRD